jgi:hypothetical protein
MWPFARRSLEEKLADRQEKDRLRAERADAQHAFEQLLDKAAAISSAKVVCHRDTWRFADSCARTRNSYTPPISTEITELPGGMREVRVSGPNLVDLLITTRNIGSKSWDTGDRAVGSRIYVAIAEIVDTVDTGVKGGATVPPIVIDAAPNRTNNESKE